ncbi:MAG: SDR family NAD(P)-dependent oxidoreductase [Acetivibrionales bacterium]|jgi:NAD(P)-dependent dehydrogenase (short-subunit alcohol dehydrogenase family)
MELEGRIAIITGASSGIGAEIARFFLKEGAKVVGCGLDEKPPFSAPDYIYVPADMCRQESAKQVVDRCIQRYGRLDILVNSAGVTGIGNIHNTSVEEFKRQFEVNVFGVYIMTKAAIGEISKSEHGTVINIVSELGVKAIADRIAYCPSKAAVEMLTRCLAIECGPSVRVNGILPGLTETPMTRDRFEMAPDPDTERKKASNRYILKRLCTTEDVANAAVFLASDRSSFITGSMIAVCGGGHFTTCQ